MIKKHFFVEDDVQARKSVEQVCLPRSKVRDLFVELENFLDFQENFVVREKKKVAELKRMVFEKTHG